jgi:hypothetical protein
MKLYHGSNVEVVTPILIQSARALDFGQAFYLTSDFDQASRWAKTSVSEDEALRRLLPQRLRDQFALKTEAAIACLKFIEGSVV